MSGLSGGHSDVDRLEVTHFSEEDDIRTLAQSGAKCADIGLGVGVDLALIIRFLEEPG